MAEKKKKKEFGLENLKQATELILKMVDKAIEEKIKGEELLKLLDEMYIKKPTAEEESAGAIYAYCDGRLEMIADHGELVLTDYMETPYSLAIKALNAERLPVIEDPEMMDKVKELLGDELFEELSVHNARTLEIKPVESDEEKLEKAKQAYYFRKEAGENWLQKLLADASGTDKKE